MTHQTAPKAQFPHYFKPVPYPHVDVYRVLQLFAVDHPALQHAAKKVLCAGERGSKAWRKDVEEAVVSLRRALDMDTEDAKVAEIKAAMPRPDVAFDLTKPPPGVRFIKPEEAEQFGTATIDCYEDKTGRDRASDAPVGQNTALQGFDWLQHAGERFPSPEFLRLLEKAAEDRERKVRELADAKAKAEADKRAAERENARIRGAMNALASGVLPNEFRQAYERALQNCNLCDTGVVEPPNKPDTKHAPQFYGGIDIGAAGDIHVTVLTGTALPRPWWRGLWA